MKFIFDFKIKSIIYSKSRNIFQSCKVLSSNKRHCDEETWNNAIPIQKMPGPKAWPIIGNTWRFLPVIGEFDAQNLQKMFRDLHKKYGDVVKLDGIPGRQSSVNLFKPEYAEMIYKLEGISPERNVFPSMTYFRDNYKQEIFKDVKGLLTSNGDDWYQFRNKVNSIMMQPRAGKQYIPTLNEIAKDFINSIKDNLTKENKFYDDFLKQTNKWSLDSISSIALEKRLGLLNKNLPESDPAYKLMTIVEDVFLFGFKLDLQPSLWRIYPTRTFKKAMKTYGEQIDLSQGFINEAIEKLKESKDDSEEASILKKLLEIDPKVAVVMATDMLLGGVDTTSTAFVNALYYLSVNPDKQEKLRTEIKTTFPNKNIEIADVDIGSLVYLKSCIKESNRLYPVIPGTMRILTKDVVIGGYQIPKGWTVIFPHMYLSIIEGQFPRPNEYLPERWLRNNIDSDISYKKAHPFCTMPFGFGSRSCIGRRFAELELEIGLINMIRSFEVSWDGPPPTRTTTSVNYLKGPYHFVFEETNE